MPDEKTYQEALEARRGRARIDPVFDGLVGDFRAAHGVAPLWIRASVGWEGWTKGRPILEIVVERTRDLPRARVADPAHPYAGPLIEPTKVVAGMVAARIPPGALEQVFSLPADAARDWSRDLVVRIADLETWMLRRCVSLTPEETREFEQSLGLGDALWMTARIVQSVVVFVHTDEQARAIRAAGIPEAWGRTYGELAARHDEFGYASPGWVRMEVDSKETFERDWKGNWVAYIK